MADAALDFASLLCSRLCHDVMSPVGAMGNGLELLAVEDEPEMRERCMTLLADSARAAADKLKFFRLAFGAAGGFGDDIAIDEVRGAVEGLARGNARLTLEWLVARPALGKVQAKILLNLVMIAVDALVRGGTLTVGAEEGEVVVRAEGPRLVLDRELRGVLLGEGDATAVSSRNAQAWLIMRLAAQHGGSVSLADGEPGVLLLGATLPPR